MALSYQIPGRRGMQFPQAWNTFDAMALSQSLRTSQLARATSVGRETLRFYEKKGLLPKPSRTSSGYRMYPADAVQLIRFIKEAQDAGFTLKEIQRLVRLRETGAATCGRVSHELRRKAELLAEQLEMISRRHALMKKLAASCERKAGDERCTIFARRPSRASACC